MAIPATGDDEPAIDNNGDILDFPVDNNNSNSFKFKQQITGKTEKGGTKNVKIMVPLKYLSNFWRTLEMSLVNSEFTLQLTCSKRSILAASNVANQVSKFEITGTKLYVPVVTLSTQENTKLLKELEFGFKRTIDWNKYHSKIRSEAQNKCFN